MPEVKIIFYTQFYCHKVFQTPLNLRKESLCITLY